MVVAATPQEKAEWVQHICKANGKKPLLSECALYLMYRLSEIAVDQPRHHAPMWVPDYSADYCMNCHRNGKTKKFTTLTRRVLMCTLIFFSTTSTTAGTVVRLCAAHAAQRSLCWHISPPSHCECVITVILRML